MRKLLGILASIGIVATAGSAVVSCSKPSWNQNKNADLGINVPKPIEIDKTKIANATIDDAPWLNELDFQIKSQLSDYHSTNAKVISSTNQYKEWENNVQMTLSQNKIEEDKLSQQPQTSEIAEQIALLEQQDVNLKKQSNANNSKLGQLAGYSNDLLDNISTDEANDAIVYGKLSEIVTNNGTNGDVMVSKVSYDFKNTVTLQLSGVPTQATIDKDKNALKATEFQIFNLNRTNSINPTKAKFVTENGVCRIELTISEQIPVVFDYQEHSNAYWYVYINQNTKIGTGAKTGVMAGYSSPFKTKIYQSTGISSDMFFSWGMNSDGTNDYSTLEFMTNTQNKDLNDLPNKKASYDNKYIAPTKKNFTIFPSLDSKNSDVQLPKILSISLENRDNNSTTLVIKLDALISPDAQKTSLTINIAQSDEFLAQSILPLWKANNN